MSSSRRRRMSRPRSSSGSSGTRAARMDREIAAHDAGFRLDLTQIGLGAAQDVPHALTAQSLQLRNFSEGQILAPVQLPEAALLFGEEVAVKVQKKRPVEFRRVHRAHPLFMCNTLQAPL